MPLARYVEFQLEHALKPLLNIGVGANTIQMEGPGVFHCDLDRWRYQNCIQCDAHKLPFKDDSFASVLCGDVLEHFVNPLRALQEMHRVAPRLVLTTFQEWRLPGSGQYIKEGFELFSPMEDAFIPYREAGQFLDFYPESKISHLPHINQWSGMDELTGMIEQAGFVIEQFEVACPGIHEEHAMLNYLFLLRRA